MSRAYLPQLTGIRFFAASAVLFYHFAPYSGIEAVNNLRGVLGDGGVSLFFVLSGFVLTINYRDEGGALLGSRSKYIISRIARIYPQYLLAFVLGAPAAIALTLVHGYPPLVATAAIGAHALAYLSLLQSWVPPLAYSWIGPAWSLSCEAAFYAAFLFIVPKPSRQLIVWSIIAVAALTLAVVMAHASHAGDLSWRNFWYFFPPLRLGEFVLGIVAAQASRLLPADSRLRKQGDWLAAGAFALVALVGLTGHAAAFRLATSCLFPLAIFALAVAEGALVRALSAAPLQLLGKASFGLYLFQFPVINFYLYFTTGELGDKVSGWGEFAIYFIVANAFAILAFLVWEKPMEKRLRARLTRLAEAHF